MRATEPRAEDRLLVVSHAAAIEANQLIYEALEGLGWEVHLVIPRTWCDGFDGRPFATRLLPTLRAHGRRLRIIQPGQPQRHLYIDSPRAVVKSVRPRVAFVEEETFAAAAWQWGRALTSAGVPFGAQQDENLDRSLPLPAQYFRHQVLARASFVAARSPRAAELVAGTRAEFVPHPVIEWEATTPVPSDDGFTVGYAGRLVEAKGVRDLVAAVETMPGTSLLVVGDGELRPTIEAAASRTGRIELLTDVRHADMPNVYGRMDVLVLPSRTTPTWTEQFGRVLVEAMWSGVPVVGSSSGEIPWVIESTGGGVVFPEGDVETLTCVLEQLRDDPERRRTLAEAGRRAVADQFSMSAVSRVMDGLLRDLVDGPAPTRS